MKGKIRPSNPKRKANEMPEVEKIKEKTWYNCMEKFNTKETHKYA